MYRTTFLHNLSNAWISFLFKQKNWREAAEYDNSILSRHNLTFKYTILSNELEYIFILHKLMDLTIFCDLESPFDRRKAKKEKKKIHVNYGRMRRRSSAMPPANLIGTIRLGSGIGAAHHPRNSMWFTSVACLFPPSSYLHVCWETICGKWRKLSPWSDDVKTDVQLSENRNL